MRYKGSASSDPGNTIPDGDYFLICTHVQDKDKSGADLKSKKGNPMWVLEFSVAEGDYAGRKLWHYLVWLPEGAPGHGMTLRCIHAFGMDPEGEADYHPNHFLNVTVKARVGTDIQEGFSPKNVIKRWHVPEGEISKVGMEEGDGQPPADGSGDASFDEGNEGVAKPAASAKSQAAKPKQSASKKAPLWGSRK